jgi:hypothetical protein
MLGGKISYPFKTTPLVRDGDFTPQGFASRFSQPFGATEQLMNVGSFWVEERASDDDSYLTGTRLAVVLAQNLLLTSAKTKSPKASTGNLLPIHHVRFRGRKEMKQSTAGSTARISYPIKY